MSYDVLELRELEYERYERHPVVLEYNCLELWRQRHDNTTYIFCEIYVNGTRLQELLEIPIEEGEEMPDAVGWFDGFRTMLLTQYGRYAGYEYSFEGYFPIFWDGMHDPTAEGDIAVHVRVDNDDVVWDGYFREYSTEACDLPVNGPTFRFRREQYEAAIRALCAHFGLDPC